MKNRLHLDLRPRSATRDEELETLLVHGATVVADQRGKYGPGTGWVVLADPEGNEFCILRSDAEVGAGRPLNRLGGEAPYPWWEPAGRTRPRRARSSSDRCGNERHQSVGGRV